MQDDYCKEIGITREQFDKWSRNMFTEMPSKAQLFEMLRVYRIIYGDLKSAYSTYLDFEERAVQAVALYLFERERKEFRNNFNFKFLGADGKNEAV